jgi:hypothetical protein
MIREPLPSQIDTESRTAVDVSNAYREETWVPWKVNEA